MGLNTTIVVLNDYTHRFDADTTLGTKLANMLKSGEIGDVVPGMKIIETHHADYDVLVRVGGNRGAVEKS